MIISEKRHTSSKNSAATGREFPALATLQTDFQWRPMKNIYRRIPFVITRQRLHKPLRGNAINATLLFHLKEKGTAEVYLISKILSSALSAGILMSSGALTQKIQLIL